MMDQPLRARWMSGHIDRRTPHADAVDRIRSEIRTLEAPGNLPGGIVGGSGYDSDVMAFGGKAFAQLSIVFGNADQIGSIVDADQKNTHEAQSDSKFRM